MFKLILALSAAALIAAPMDAQVATQLQDGIRVRVVKNSGRATVGFLSSRTPDSLSITGARSGGAVRTFALEDISHVDVSRGKSRAKGGLLKGLMGLGIGALGAGIIGAATYGGGDKCEPGPNNSCMFSCFMDCSRSDAAIFAGMLGAGAGLVAGTVYGIATGWEHWESVPARIR